MAQYQSIVDDLLLDTGASRTTLRLDTPGLNFPAVAEGLAPGVQSIKSDNSLDQRGAATARRLLETGEPLVQPDTATADPPPPRPLVDVYGVKAQMLIPVARDREIVGWLSVHYNPAPREWTAADVEALRHAARRVEGELAHTRGPGLRELGDGVALWTVEAGSGRPILFLHGWGTNSIVWRTQLAALAGEHHVLAIDQRGFGASPGAPAPTTARFADDVRRFLVSERLDDVLLVGWSMGALVTLSYLEQFGSERLRAVGIVDVSPRLTPAPDWGLGEGVGQEIGAALERWCAAWPGGQRQVYTDVVRYGFHEPGEREAEIEWLVAESLRSDPAFAMDALVDLFACDFRESVKRIDVPTLLAYGAHSTSTTRHVAEYMAAAIPQARLELFERSGHALFVEEQERFNEVLDRFAKTH